MAWLLELILLMAPCSYVVLTSIGNLTVTQSPSEQQLLVGQSMEIICSWNVCSEVQRFRVEWRKINHLHNNITHKETALIRKDLYNKTTPTSETRKEDLKLQNLKRNDSGFYFCYITIEIPIYKKGRGQGTRVTVKEENEKSKIQGPWWALAILLLTLSTCLSYYYMKQRNSKRNELNRTDQEEGEEAEYIEMRKRNKEDEGTPSNTTEWTVSVLYEPMTSFAQKPVEQRENDIYTFLCWDSLPALSPGPSAMAPTTSTDAPEAPSEVLEKGKSLDIGYRWSNFSSAGTSLTQSTTQTRCEQTGVKGNEEFERPGTSSD